MSSKVEAESVYFINAFPPNNYGGGEVSRFEWSRTFQSKGLNVVWYHPTDSESFCNNTDTALNLPAVSRAIENGTQPGLRRFAKPSEIQNFINTARREQPETIIFNGHNDFNLPLLAAVLICLPRQDVIQIFHGDPKNPFHPERGNRIKKEVKKPIRAILDRTFAQVYQSPQLRRVAVSEATLTRVKGLGLIEDADVIYPPTYIDNFCHPSALLNKESPLLQATTISRVTYAKGLEWLAEVAENSHTASLPYEFSLIGGNAQHEQWYFDQISPQLTPFVRLKGPRFGKDLCQSYNESDLKIMPSPNEGFPLTTREALLHGRPVLARAIAPHREIFSLFSSPPGLLVDSHNQEKATQEAMEFLRAYSEDPLMRHRLSCLALEEAQRKIDPITLIEEFTSYALRKR